MARLLLLADSNFQNNYGNYPGRKIKDLGIKSCQSRRVAMSELASVNEGIVVVACLDMIAAEVSKSTPDQASEAVEVFYNQILHKLIECVDMADGKLAVGVVAPIFWTTHSAPVKRSMHHAYKLMKKVSLQGIYFTEYMKDVNAGPDGTHLTSISANRYIQHIVEFFSDISEKSGVAPVDLEGVELVASGSGSWAEDQPSGQDPEAVVSLAPPEDSDMPSPTRTLTMLSASMLSSSFGRASGPNPRPLAIPVSTRDRLMRLAHGPSTGVDLSVPPPLLDGARLQGHDVWRSPDVLSSLQRIERRLGCLEAKSFYDNVMMAGLKEEQDAEANKAMLNRVIFSKVNMPNLANLTDEARLNAIKGRINEIIESVKSPDKQYKILFVKHLNHRVRGQKKGVIEVKLESPQQAADLRADFVKMQKESEEDRATRMNINPVVRLSTRVRVEILHSVVDLYKRHDPSVVRAMCLQYIPKPVIKIIRKSAGGTEFARTMTFIEAVCWVKENDYCNTIKLGRAYERAGSAFRATMTQNFVLMSSSSI